ICGNLLPSPRFFYTNGNELKSRWLVTQKCLDIIGGALNQRVITQHARDWKTWLIYNRERAVAVGMDCRIGDEIKKYAAQRGREFSQALGIADLRNVRELTCWRDIDRFLIVEATP